MSNFDKAMEIVKNNAPYRLLWTAYDDELTDDQIDIALEDHSLDPLYITITESEWYREELWYRLDETIKDLFDEELWDSMTADEQDEIRYAIEERDETDVVRELIQNTRKKLFVAPLPKYETDSLTDYLQHFGLDAPVGDMEQGQWDFESWWCNVEVIWYGELREVLDNTKLRITDPFLWVGDTWDGSGTLLETTGEIEFDTTTVVRDVARAYGANAVCGFYLPALEPVSVEVVDSLA